MDRFRGSNTRLVEKLNRLRVICDRLEHLRGDPYISVQQNPKGTTIGLNVQNLLKRIPKVGGGGAGGISGTFVLLTSVAGSEPPYVYSGDEVVHDGSVYFEPVDDHWETPSDGATFSGNLFSLAELDAGGAGLYKMAIPSVVLVWSVGNGNYVFDRHFPCGAYQ